jgi:transcriptional regulator
MYNPPHFAETRHDVLVELIRQANIGELITLGPDGLRASTVPLLWEPDGEHGKVVPTWNYVSVHVRGPLVIHDDRDWVRVLVSRLTDHHEEDRDMPWSIDDAPTDFIDKQLAAIVGIEIPITTLEGKQKLSQNRPAADIEGVVVGLQSRAPSDQATARAMIAADFS